MQEGQKYRNNHEIYDQGKGNEIIRITDCGSQYFKKNSVEPAPESGEYKETVCTFWLCGN